MSGERIAKVLARAGVASRREVERMIADRRVALNGEILSTPAVLVGPDDVLAVDGKRIAAAEPTRLFRYHKPRGLVVTHKDPEGRPTVFEKMPPGMPRVISVGRLDYNSEGLLLLTNDGELARRLELPANAWLRRYRVRVHGTPAEALLKSLAKGVKVDGVQYGPIEAGLDSKQGANSWLTVSIKEGKNREVRRVMEHLGLTVNRLLRVGYGPFPLGQLKPGEIEEVPTRVLRSAIGGTSTTK
jgi:23S rRNA pseudouridine2605 synthase